MATNKRSKKSIGAASKKGPQKMSIVFHIKPLIEPDEDWNMFIRWLLFGEGGAGEHLRLPGSDTLFDKE